MAKKKTKTKAKTKAKPAEAVPPKKLTKSERSHHAHIVRAATLRLTSKDISQEAWDKTIATLARSRSMLKR